MDALDSFENLTELGQHLVDLPIEPRLGWYLLCSSTKSSFRYKFCTVQPQSFHSKRSSPHPRLVRGRIMNPLSQFVVKGDQWVPVNSGHLCGGEGACLFKWCESGHFSDLFLQLSWV